MGKYAKIDEKTANIFKGCYKYFDVNDTYNVIEKKYTNLIKELDETIEAIDEERRKEMEENDTPWSQARLIRMEERVEAVRNKGELTDLMEASLKPYKKERAEAQRMITNIGGLYDAYCLSIEKGSWDTVGSFTREKKRKGEKVIEHVYVLTSFNKKLVALLTNEGVKFNKKSAAFCAEGFMTRLGGKPSKDCKIQAFSKRDFTRLFVACAIDYAEKHMTIEECGILEG